ncbi:MAG TPA: metallophosphoesterase family protein [Gemmataceae bacterium]|jgi:hypothetical protein
MLLGLLADIHEAVPELDRALAEFRRRGVDQVVSLGDACDLYGPGSRTADVTARLRDARAVGVWGNHDFGLCHEVPDAVRRRADPAMLAYMAGMRPHLVVGDCRFSHVEPWLDAHTAEGLWYFDGPPETAAAAARSFAAVPERHLFVGHFHRWLAVTPAGPLPWAGDGPLDLAGHPRSLVVVAAVVGGWCATFDTAAARLDPIRCGPPAD